MQVNLGELLKQSGIVGDDESFFMDDEPQLPPLAISTAAVAVAAPITQPLIQQQPPLQSPLQQPTMVTSLLETKENNVTKTLFTIFICIY